MVEQEAVFEGNWEDQLQDINNEPEENLYIQNPQSTKKTRPQNENQAESLKSCSIIDRLRSMTDEQFQLEYRDKGKVERTIGQSPTFMTSQKDFVQLSKTVSKRLLQQSAQEPDKTLPDNHIVLFFEEMLLYIYPKYSWQNIEHVKQKVKIVKKDRKEDENKARKIKQKQERLKRTTQLKQESIQQVKIEVKQESTMPKI